MQWHTGEDVHQQMTACRDVTARHYQHVIICHTLEQILLVVCTGNDQLMTDTNHPELTRRFLSCIKLVHCEVPACQHSPAAAAAATGGE
jgi:hypothetical protein